MAGNNEEFKFGKWAHAKLLILCYSGCLQIQTHISHT